MYAESRPPIKLSAISVALMQIIVEQKLPRYTKDAKKGEMYYLICHTTW